MYIYIHISLLVLLVSHIDAPAWSGMVTFLVGQSNGCL